MTALSSIPAVKAAIVDALTAALSPVQVSYGDPGPEGRRRKSVWAGGLAEWDKQWAAIGSNRTDEEYTLDLNVVAGDPDATSFRTTTELVFGIAGDVNTAVQALRSIAGVTLTVPLLVVPKPAGFTEFFTADRGAGRASLLELGVRVRARLA